MNSIPDKAQYIVSVIDEQLQKHTKRPIIVGLSAPQGSGKSTILSHLLANSNLRIAGMSLDDFYYGYKELSSRGIPQRGPPGTHDTSLLLKILTALSQNSQQTVNIPVYDKLACGGHGDRLPEDQWTSISTPIDVTLLEGWMLGFGLGESNNEDLKQYMDIWRMIDYWIVFEVKNLNIVYKWRFEQEVALAKERARPKKEIDAFVDAFMPFYKRYYQNLINYIYKESIGIIIPLGDDRSFLIQ